MSINKQSCNVENNKGMASHLTFYSLSTMLLLFIFYNNNNTVLYTIMNSGHVVPGVSPHKVLSPYIWGLVY